MSFELRFVLLYTAQRALSILQPQAAPMFMQLGERSETRRLLLRFCEFIAEPVCECLCASGVGLSGAKDRFQFPELRSVLWCRDLRLHSDEFAETSKVSGQRV